MNPLEFNQDKSNCNHKWKAVAIRPTMMPGDNCYMKVEWCCECGSLGLENKDGTRHITNPKEFISIRKELDVVWEKFIESTDRSKT